VTSPYPKESRKTDGGRKNATQIFRARKRRGTDRKKKRGPQTQSKKKRKKKDELGQGEGSQTSPEKLRRRNRHRIGNIKIVKTLTSKGENRVGMEKGRKRQIRLKGWGWTITGEKTYEQ